MTSTELWHEDDDKLEPPDHEEEIAEPIDLFRSGPDKKPTGVRSATQGKHKAQAAGADPFTDAALAETVADRALRGLFYHTTALGWLRWNGQHWAACDDDDVVEVIRQHVRSEYIRALQRKATAAGRGDQKEAGFAEFDEQGWHRFQSRAKLDALFKLSRGLEFVKRDAADFDRDPDVLNTPAGLLHLDTLELEPHDPKHLVTRITAVSYTPGYTHPMWTTVLQALPDDAHVYLQARLGQAITGHQPDDDVMVMLTGGGNNGKTAVMTTVVNALGDVVRETGYAQLIASELLLTGGNKGAATPEKMELRGARLAYMEETPEDRYMSVNTLKQLVGTPIVKGRKLYKDTVTWRASHSLFLNTNFPPKVVEVDEASWRRLTRLDFPWRFRAVDAEGQPLDNKGEWLDTDRAANPLLKRAVGAEGPGDPDVLRAALAWLVEGAHAWYQRDRSLKTLRMPASVVASVAEWRGESDYIQAFASAELVADRTSWITSEELYEAFSEFMDNQSRRGRDVTPSQTVFIDRLKRHTGLGFPVQAIKKRIGAAGQSRRAMLIADKDHGKERKAIAGVRFATREDWSEDAA